MKMDKNHSLYCKQLLHIDLQYRILNNYNTKDTTHMMNLSHSKYILFGSIRLLYLDKDSNLCYKMHICLQYRTLYNSMKKGKKHNKYLPKNSMFFQFDNIQLHSLEEDSNQMHM